MPSPTLSNDTLVAVILALQFAAFGWRINREISIGDQSRRVWLPIPDILNIISMILVIVSCVILPLAKINPRSDLVLSIAYVLIAMYPLTTAAHYRLFTTEGRGKYDRLGKDWPYITDWEWAAICVTLIFVVGTLCLFNH